MNYRSFSDKLKKLPYGGDYNPEQWPEEVWEEDMRFFKEAGIDTLSVNIFSWAALQPSEDEYNFTKLDKIMALLKENHMNVILATSTAAHPAWMAKKYPEITRVNFLGIKRKFGGRHNSCPNSPVYRKYSARLAGKIAERYKDYDNIVAWHISNEFNTGCYCENCERAFREWVKKKYKTLDEVNRVWNTAFWGHTFYDFDEIVVQNNQTECNSPTESEFPGITLDYRRFMDESMLECYKLEYEAVKKFTPDVPVTTNFMAFFEPLNYQKWARSMDFVSWDSYPTPDEDPANTSMWHDLMRSMKQGDPFLLMEQTPNVQNWQPYNAIKRPGVMRLWSYRAVAHGSDGVCFFQMRRTRGASEKTHGAVIEHAGTDKTRTFREIEELGGELKALGGELLGLRTDARAAIIFDWENWWDFELCSGPSRDPEYKSYPKEVMRWYRAFYERNVNVDIVSPEDDLSAYKLVVAPLLFMLRDGFAEKAEAFVSAGGVFVCSAYTGLVDEHDLAFLGGYPGPLKDLFGVWVEETDVLPPGDTNSFVYKGVTYEASQIYDIMGSHEEDTEVLSAYGSDFYAGKPVLTKHPFGEGAAYYFATRSTPEFYRKFIGDLIHECGIRELLPAIGGVEVTCRENETDEYLFILNHNAGEVVLTEGAYGTDLLTGKTVSGSENVTLPGKGVMILKRKK